MEHRTLVGRQRRDAAHLVVWLSDGVLDPRAPFVALGATLREGQRGVLRLPKKVALGWFDRRRLSAAYRRAAVLVMPSRWQEPFGIVGLEALTLGTPVAVWDSGGVRERHPGGELLLPWATSTGWSGPFASARDRQAIPRAGSSSRSSFAGWKPCTRARPELKDLPYLEPDDIVAVLEFAARQHDHPVLRSA